jgi:hypothetical protein
MTRAGWAGWLLFLLLVPGPLVLPAYAQESDELIDQLEEWLVEPLDLTTATADELALLPWLDMGLATAIVSLREHGGLSTLSDLDQVVGMDAARRTALTPFVTLPLHAHDTRFQFEERSSWRRGAPSGRRSRLTLQRDQLTVLAQRDERVDSRTCGAARLSESWGTLVLGDFRPSLSWPLLLSNPSLRSRTASPSLSSESHLRPRLSSTGESWRGGGLEIEAREWHLLLASGTQRGNDDAPFLALVEHRFLKSKHSTVGLALRDGHQAGLFLGLMTKPLSARFEWVRRLVFASPGSDRMAAALRFQRGPLRWGLALTQAGPSPPGGQDPITGQTLDREHRVLQTSGRISGGAWTFAALARQRRRGRIGGAELSRRWQLEAAGPLATARLDCRLRADEAPGTPSSFTLSARWRERSRVGAWARGLRVRHQRDGVSSATLVALSLQRGESWLWRGEWALSRGDRSSPWAVGVATAGLSSTWLSPGDSGLLLALARRDATCSGAFYLRLRGDLGGSPELSGGLGVSLRLQTPP